MFAAATSAYAAFASIVISRPSSGNARASQIVLYAPSVPSSRIVRRPGCARAGGAACPGWGRRRSAAAPRLRSSAAHARAQHRCRAAHRPDLALDRDPLLVGAEHRGSRGHRRASIRQDRGTLLSSCTRSGRCGTGRRHHRTCGRLAGPSARAVGAARRARRGRPGGLAGRRRHACSGLRGRVRRERPQGAGARAALGRALAGLRRGASRADGHVRRPQAHGHDDGRARRRRGS